MSLKSIFDEIMEMIDECPILTYNGTSFDIAFLQREFEREGLEAHLDTHKYIDAFDIEKRMNSHKLADVYRRLFGERSRGWPLGHAGDEGPHLRDDGGGSGWFSSGGPRVRFLTR